MSNSQEIIWRHQHDDEIDLLEVFHVPWQGKWLVGVITAVTTVVAEVIALMLLNICRAEALLAPKPDEGTGGGGLASLAAQYGNLASLAGINLNIGSTGKASLGPEVLQSRKFISEFIERHKVLMPWMVANGWDPETSQLVNNADK